MDTPTPVTTARALGGPFRGFGPVFFWGIRRAFSAKRAWIGLVLAAAGGALMGASVGRGAVDPLAELWTHIDEELLRVVAPVIALLMVAQGFASEVRDGTLLYHLVRPVPRHVVYLGRFASGWVAGLVASVVLVSGMAMTATKIPVELWFKLLVVVLFTVTALGALYYTLATLLKRGLIAGLIYTFLVEVLLGQMPGSIQNAAVNYHARSMYHGWCDGWFAAQSDGVKSRMLQGDPSNPFGSITYESPTSAIFIMLCIAAGCLLFGIWRIRNRDFPLKD